MPLTDVAQLQEDPALTVYSAPSLSTLYLSINRDWQDAQGARPFADVRVRQALAHALNKDGLAQTAYSQLGVYGQDHAPALSMGL